MLSDNEALDAVAAGQEGVVSRRQALAAGLCRTTIASRLRNGHWQRMFPRVYATFSGPPPRRAVLWGALLYAGEGAMLSHETAAELAGLCDRDAGAEVHVTVPAERRVVPVPGIVVHRSRRAAASRHPARVLAQTKIEETVLDLVGVAGNLDEAIGWLTRACGRRLSTPERLRATLARRPRLRRRSEIAEVLASVAAGCHSPLELRYLREVEHRHGLPCAQRQHSRQRRGGRWYDDVRYLEYATVVELDGRVAHADEQRWRDLTRDNAGVAAGLCVLRYGNADVADRACAVAAQVSVVLWRNGWRGAPVPCGPHCAVHQILNDRGTPDTAWSV